MANGTTHYLLYNWCVKHDEPICIVEHDSVFIILGKDMEEITKFKLQSDTMPGIGEVEWE